VLAKLNAMNTPDTENVHSLCRESVTSHGKDERIDATDAPSPNRTSNAGSAQQSSVLTDVKREK
jgi:hypothetical protein